VARNSSLITLPFEGGKATGAIYVNEDKAAVIQVVFNWRTGGLSSGAGPGQRIFGRMAGFALVARREEVFVVEVDALRTEKRGSIVSTSLRIRQFIPLAQ
jgi:hypothetical protein